MHYQIIKGSIELSGNTILKDISFEIKDKMKIAVVGRNGAGKTTLLRAVAGEIDVFGENHDVSCVAKTGELRIGFLKQLAFESDEVTLEYEVKRAFSRYTDIKERLDELLLRIEREGDTAAAQEYAELQEYFEIIGGYYYEKEYDTVLSSFGFTEADKHRLLREFSGGQRTKIAFARLLLSKPDILLLDEPTNHLDLNATVWLEEYLKSYPSAVILVSHDRMFLDRIVDTVYEAERGSLTKYHGNYSAFMQQKKENYLRRRAEYEAQQKEIARLTELVERFRYKATKAAMAQSKIKAIERLTPLPPPEKFDLTPFYTDLTPTVQSAGTALYVQELGIGYDKLLSTVELEMKRGKKIGIIGSNGIGKSTFLKTLAGAIPPLSGSFRFGAGVTLGYFDQQMAGVISEKTVLEDYTDTYPFLTHTQARSELGAFLFSGDDVFKKISVLSGGERVRLALCKLFRNKPNFLLLDEPTNHMDIVGKEALENMLSEFSGTLLCVSHDRYFLKQVVDSLLIFEESGVTYFPYDYETWSQKQTEKPAEPVTAEARSEKKAEQKKERFTTPLKILDKKKKRLKKVNEGMAQSEEKLAALNNLTQDPEIMSDYQRLCEINEEITHLEEELLALMEEAETLEKELAQME